VSAAAFQLSAQTPTINPPNGNPPGLQSGLPGGIASLPAAITSGTFLPNGFTLFINGSFTPGNFLNVTWLNTVTNQPATFGIEDGVLSITATQIQVAVPQALFSTLVASAQAVTITVTEQVSGSPPTTAAATYTINPPLAALASAPLLPSGTVGVAYSQPMAQGGTPPYNVSIPVPDPTPPGLPLPTNSILLSGIPTQTGLFTWGVQIVDAWDNFITLTEGMEVVNPSTVTAPLSLSTVPAGSPAFTLTVNGSNFVPAAALLQAAIPSSLAQWTPPIAAAGTSPLVTTVLNSGQLTASVPQGYLLVPGTALVSVVQPGGAVSNALPFLIAGPTITAPAPITARTIPVTVVINGTNFVQNAGLAPVQSTLLINNAPVATNFLSGASLSTSGVFPAGQYSVQVVNPGGSASSNTVTLSVLPAPTLSSLSPAVATPNGPAFTLTVTGANFTNTMQIVLGGRTIATNFVNASTLTATVPTGTFTTTGSTLVTVVTADNYSPTPLTLPVYTPVQILTASLPGGTYQAAYDAKLAATGGLAPYTWSATGLQGLSINRGTGEITGSISSATAFVVTVTVTDANGLTATTPFSIAVTVPIPRLQINSGAALPNGQVGVAYGAAITANGGSGDFSFSTVGGSLPPGLSLSSGGAIAGVPTAYGTFSFAVQVSDTSGNTATGGFSILIKPAPLTVTGPAAIANVTLGSTIGLKFGATGGIPPYSFNVSGNLPPGTSFGRDASLTGTANAVGTFAFTVYAFDSQQTQASKGFSLTVTAAALTVVGSLGDGQVGAAYSGSLGASGGQPPYTLTASGFPDGVSFANGSVGGTPTTPGIYTVKASATDAAGAQATASFNINIAPAPLTVTTASLGNGTVGVAYSAAVSATGGVPPYTFSFGGLPGGVTGLSGGSIGGTPTAAGTFSVTATVTDSKGATASKTYTVTIAVAPLSITSAAAPNATVGTAVSATFTAAGGAPPYTWSATGLPAGLTLSAAGALSGTPTAPGSPSFTVTVKDTAGTTASQTVKMTIALPPSPTLNLTGLPATSSPATQSTLQIGIAAAYPVDVTVTLTLTFAADSGPDDPTVQFSTGGRSVALTITAGSLAALNSVGVQTGTVAGTATITARLTAASQDITPSPAPTRTVRINAAAPVATTVTATISGSGFTVTIVGYATTRSITSAVFTFTPASGANLQTTTVTIPVDQLFSAWYASAASAAFGSQFTFTQPFTVQGGVSAIASVTVTLVNATGSSTPVTATLH
jgi:hypothetical protein